MSTASETVDETEEEAAPRPSLVLRLKRLLVAPLLLLRRLRRPKVETEGEEAEDAKPDARDARREEGDEEEHLPASFPDNPTGDGPLEPKAIEEVVDHDQEAEDKENFLHLAPFYHSRMGMSSPPSTALRTGR